jgi:hypothetical protein
MLCDVSSRDTRGCGNSTREVVNSLGARFVKARQDVVEDDVVRLRTILGEGAGGGASRR